MVRGQQWPEAAQQIVLMAFLQRLVNGGGYIEREYGLGQKRLDLLVRWFTGRGAEGLPTDEDRHALELKVWRDGQKDPLAKGLEQIDGYLERLGLLGGTLVLFDARSSAPTGEAWEGRGEYGNVSQFSMRGNTVRRSATLGSGSEPEPAAARDMKDRERSAAGLASHRGRPSGARSRRRRPRREGVGLYGWGMSDVRFDDAGVFALSSP